MAPNHKQLVDALVLCRRALAQAEVVTELSVEHGVRLGAYIEPFRVALKEISDAKLTAELVLSIEAGRAAKVPA